MASYCPNGQYFFPPLQSRPRLAKPVVEPSLSHWPHCMVISSTQRASSGNRLWLPRTYHMVMAEQRCECTEYCWTAHWEMVNIFCYAYFITHTNTHSEPTTVLAHPRASTKVSGITERVQWTTELTVPPVNAGTSQAVLCNTVAPSRVWLFNI